MAAAPRSWLSRSWLPRSWLPLLLLFDRSRLAAAVMGCDGSATAIDECNLPEDENTLSYCECNYCQTYGTPIVAFGGNPPGGSFDSDFAGVTLSWIVPGIQSNHTLCLLHWAFIKVPTTHVNAQGEVEGQGVVVSIDTEYDAGENRFTSVDILEITSGSLPEAYASVHTENYPYDVFGLAQSYADGPWEGNRGGHKLFFKQDSYMYSSGYDPEGEQCRGGQPEFLYFGVRCGNNDEGITDTWDVPDEPCRFTVNVHLLPYELEAGDLLDNVPIQQGTTHYYGMAVGEYDVLRVSFERLGNNLTATDLEGNVVATSGHGLIGNLLFDVDNCPTWEKHMEYHALTNMSKSVVREWFCTTAGEGGRYTLALEAAPVFDPSGGAPGHEYPDGGKPKGAPDRLDFNPGGRDNQLRPARGHYRLEIFHVAFTAGPIGVGEVRAGCINYGQWRHFTLVSDGVHQASLVADARPRTEDGELLSGMPLSYLYARRNKRPDASTYDARVHAPSNELVTSPCALQEVRQWHVSVSMDHELRANSERLFKGYFVVNTTFESAYGATYGAADWPEEGASRVIVLPRSRGGTGHTCCGQTKLWLLAGVPALIQVQVDVNVTRGRARALLLSRGTCPSPPASCVGLCKLMWMVEYNPYSRASTYLLQETVVSGFVPLSAPPTDDWLVGVQALDGGDEAVEVTLTLSSRGRSRPVTNYTCNRLEHFCPSVQRDENVTGYDPDAHSVGTVSAAARARRRGAGWLGAGAAAIAAAALARGSRRRRS